MGACCQSTKNTAGETKKNEGNEVEQKQEPPVIKSNMLKDNVSRDNGDQRSNLGKESKPQAFPEKKDPEPGYVEKDNAKQKEMPDFNKVEDKDQGVKDKGVRSEKYKDKESKKLESEANDVHNQHQMRIIQYTNTNRSGPGDDYYGQDNNNHNDLDDIVEVYDGDELENNQKKQNFVERLDKLDDDKIIDDNDIRNEHSGRGKVEEGKHHEERSTNLGKNFKVKDNEEMSDFDDKAKGQDIIIMKNIQPKAHDQVPKSKN